MVIFLLIIFVVFAGLFGFVFLSKKMTFEKNLKMPREEYSWCDKDDFKVFKRTKKPTINYDFLTNSIKAKNIALCKELNKKAEDGMFWVNPDGSLIWLDKENDTAYEVEQSDKIYVRPDKPARKF